MGRQDFLTLASGSLSGPVPGGLTRRPWALRRDLPSTPEGDHCPVPLSRSLDGSRQSQGQSSGVIGPPHLPGGVF